MIRAAIVTVLVGATLLVCWRWRARQGLERGVRILLAMYGLFGVWALWFGWYAAPGREPAVFVLCKPTLLYWSLSAILLVAPPLGWGYPVKAIFGTYFVFSSREWRWINLGFALLCTVLGILNLVIAFAYTRDDWEGFKWSCMVNVLAVFLLRLTFVWVDTFVRSVVFLHGRVKAFFQ